jgi:polar amino acid transport system substrate-binding protein
LPLSILEIAIKITLFAICLIIGVLTAPAHAEQTLVLNTPGAAPLIMPDQTGALDILYKELGKRLGIKIVLQSLPAERCLINANAGIDDGDTGRVAGLENQYTNLIRVPEYTMQFKISVFTRNSKFTVAGYKSLKPYDVGIINGWKVLEQNIVDARSLSKLENGEQLFTMLDKDRINVAVTENMLGTMLVSQMKLKNITLLQPNLVEGNWYLYLHKKHEALVPKFAAALKEMKEDGTHQRIFDTVYKRYSF